MKVILDNDGSTDDVVALIYLLSHPRVTLEAVTIAATGEAHGPAGSHNMADLCYMLGKGDMPIAYGTDKSCDDSGVPFPDFLRERMDKLFVGKHVPKNPAPQISDSAVELIRKVLESSHDRVTIMATGPLTNIAELIQKYPALHDRIKEIVIMGGAVNVIGNIQALDRTSDNTVAEWNLYADPKAADIVFKSKIPVTLVPLDATNHVPMTEEFYNSLSNSYQPEIQLIYHLLKVIVDQFGMDIFLSHFYLWDPLAVMIGVHPDLAVKKNMSLLMDMQTAATRHVADGTEGAAQINVAVNIHRPELILKKLLDELKSNLMNAKAKSSPTNHFQPAAKIAAEITPAQPSLERRLG